MFGATPRPDRWALDHPESARKAIAMATVLLLALGFAVTYWPTPISGY